MPFLLTGARCEPYASLPECTGAALGAEVQDPLGEVAERAVATRGAAVEECDLDDCRHRIAWRSRQAAATHHLHEVDIVHVVANEGKLIRLEAVLGEERW